MFVGGVCSTVGSCDPTTQTGCPAGATCALLAYYDSGVGDYSGVGACVPDCTNTGCGAGEVCDATLRTCIQAPTAIPASVKLGAKCTSDAQCDLVPGAGGHCIVDQYFPDGYCVSVGCKPPDTDAGTPDTCGTGAMCVAWFDIGEQQQCFKTCTTNADCLDGYACNTDYGVCLGE